MKNYLANILGFKNKSKEDEFSRFFRETPLEEKKRVLGEAVRKSSEDQKALVDRYQQVKTS